MIVLVIGANGFTGQMCIQELKKGPHDPIAMIRHPDQRKVFDEMGVPTVLGDLEYPIDHAMKGCDAVIFAAGSGSKTGKDKTILVDHIGAIRSMVAAQVNGVKRYIMLSAMNTDMESDSAIAHYHRAKWFADVHLKQTDLDYTIVCPGGLTHEPGNGLVTIRKDLKGCVQTSREDLAKVLVACLDHDQTIGQQFAFFDGETPMEEALKSM